MNHLKKVTSLATILLCSITLMAQENKINWISFEEAIALNKETPKKIIVDVYTDWCGWCKRMDATTFKNPVIVDYIQKNYWAVKLDAERTDTVVLGEQIFVNPNANARRSAHQLAIALLNGKMTYPSIVYLDENIELMHPAIAGFQKPESLEQIIKYFGEEAYKSIPWDEYQKSFESEIKSKKVSLTD